MLAVVASGWATNRGENPRAFINILSNFVTETGDWLDEGQRSLSTISNGSILALHISSSRLVNASPEGAENSTSRSAA